MLNPFYLSFFIKWVSNEQSGKFFHTTSMGWHKIGTYLSLQHVAKLRHGVLFASTSVHVGEISKPRASLLLQTDQVRVILAMALRSASNFPKDNLFSSRANELVLQPFFPRSLLMLVKRKSTDSADGYKTAFNYPFLLCEEKNFSLTVVTTPLCGKNWEERPKLWTTSTAVLYCSINHDIPEMLRIGVMRRSHNTCIQ